jgi:hypothetical protein
MAMAKINAHDVDLLIRYARRQVRRPGMSCRGLDWYTTMGMIVPLVKPKDQDVFYRVLRFQDEPVEDPSLNRIEQDRHIAPFGRPRYRPHGFDVMIGLLQSGYGRLPRRAPRVFWESWCAREVSPFLRCECCWTLYGNAALLLPGDDCPACRVGELWPRESGGGWIPKIEPIETR